MKITLQGAPKEDVKKAYRDLSKKMHPDRGGDAEAFDRIAKAYQVPNHLAQ